MNGGKPKTNVALRDERKKNRGGERDQRRRRGKEVKRGRRKEKRGG